MPNSIEALERQLDKISNLLQPVIKRTEKAQEDGFSRSYSKSATLYYTDAMKSMLQESKNSAEAIIENYGSNKQGSPNQQMNSFINTCIDFIKETEKRLSLYNKYKSPYYLVIVSMTDFVQRMRFNEFTHSNDQTKELFDILKRLLIIRNISVRIYIRNLLTKLSLEMLISTIPIITFAAIIAAISNYDQYNTLLLRILFAASSTIVIMPFLLLFVRTMPVLAVIQTSSSIPFSRKEQK